jgi:hypothetical protein
VQFDADGAPIIAIIDTVDILPIKPRHKFLAAAVRMLTSLVLEPTGCNCPPRLALRRRVLLAMHRELWALQGESTVTVDAAKRALSPESLSREALSPDPSSPDTPSAGTPDILDTEWESQSTRAVWNMTQARITAHIKKHGAATPKISPL